MASGRDKQLRELTTTFRPLLIEFLQPKIGFLTGLNAFLNQEDLSRLQNLEPQKRMEAVNELLNILGKCEQPGIYAAFIQSLRKNKMGHIAEMIEHVENGNILSERLRYYKFILESFLPKLIDIDAKNMLPYLSCLTDEDKQEIKNVQQNINGAQAALKLLFYLSCHGEEWLDQLVTALRICRYRTLSAAIAEMAGKHSEEVDPKTFVSQKQAAKDYWRSEDAAKAAASQNGFENCDVYPDCANTGTDQDDDDDSHSQLSFRRPRVGSTETNEHTSRRYDDKKDDEYEEQCRSPGPNDEGSFTITYTSSPSVDNLDYDGDDDDDEEEDSQSDLHKRYYYDDNNMLDCDKEKQMRGRPQISNVGTLRKNKYTTSGIASRNPTKPIKDERLFDDIEHESSVNFNPDRSSTSILNIPKVRPHPEQLKRDQCIAKSVCVQRDQSAGKAARQQPQKAKPTQKASKKQSSCDSSEPLCASTSRDSRKQTSRQSSRDSSDPPKESTRRAPGKPPSRQSSRDSPNPPNESTSRTPIKPTSRQSSRDSPNPPGETTSRASRKPTSRQSSRDSPEPSSATRKPTSRQNSRDSPDPPGEPRSRAPRRPLSRQSSRDSPINNAKKTQPKVTPTMPTTSKTTQSKPVKKVEITESKQRTKAPSKASKKSIVGKVVSSQARWASDCCSNCFKIVENKQKLICSKCKTRFADAYDLAQRLVAEITLKTEDKKTISKMCHYPQLQQFFKDNGDAISNHRSVDELSKYLKSKKCLELLLDGRGDVAKICKR